MYVGLPEGSQFKKMWFLSQIPFTFQYLRTEALLGYLSPVLGLSTGSLRALGMKNQTETTHFEPQVPLDFLLNPKS